MNNNQDLNNVTPTNINSIPVIPPTQTPVSAPMPAQPVEQIQQPVGNNQNPIPPANNIIPNENNSLSEIPNVSNQPNSVVNNVMPNQASQNTAPIIQNDNNTINALNIGDNNNQTQVSLEPQNYNETSITDLNVDGVYNHMEKAPDYVNSPEVKENINPTKKNTITITKELKTVIIIVGVMLAFVIIIMPLLFDLINKIRFH